MKIAKRPRRSLAVSRGLRRRQARATADEVDRRLFLQLSTSAVIVAIAVLVSVAGGGIQEGMINTIEKNTGLEEVNAALTSMMESVPVIGNLFSGEGAVQVFSSGNELSDDSPTASYDFTLEPVEPMASPNDQPVDDTQQSGFDQSAFESLPDVSDATDGGVNSAAVSSQAQELSVFRFVRAMAGQQEEEPAGQPVQEMADSVPENCTLEYQPLPYALSLPLTGTVTSCFGSRDDPVNDEESFHHGLDIAAPAGTAIRAIASGKVIEVGFNAAYGNYVVVEHAGDLTSKYAHCQSILVKEGDRVKPSTKLATVGSTGVSTGNHLHLEMRLSGIFLDPALQLGVVS